MDDYFTLVDGVFLPKEYLSFKDEILDMEVHDSDVWVCTFPKSGTTWTQELAWLLLNDLDFDRAKRTMLFERFPYLESSISMDWNNYLEVYPEIVQEYTSSIEYVKDFKGRRFIKCHLPWKFMPKQMQSGEKRPKIIYITRNPKDVCVSYYYYFTKFYGFEMPFEDFCSELFISDKIIYAPYWDTVLSHLKRKDDNMLVLKFEDMKKDLRSVVDKVRKFLEVDYCLTEDQMQKLLLHLNVDSMKKNPTVNEQRVITYLKELNVAQDSAAFIRNGRVGEYKNHFDAKTERDFNNWVKLNLKKHNVSLKELPINSDGINA